jgi:hypothetical protein
MLVYSMKVKTRRQGVTLFNLTWAHTCSKWLKFCVIVCEWVWKCMTIDLGLQINFGEKGIHNEDPVNNKDWLSFPILLTHDWHLTTGKVSMWQNCTSETVVMVMVTDSVTFLSGSLEEFTSSRFVLYCTLEKNKDKQTNKQTNKRALNFWSHTSGILFWPNKCHRRSLSVLPLLLLVFDGPSCEVLELKMGLKSSNLQLPKPWFNNVRLFCHFPSKEIMWKKVRFICRCFRTQTCRDSCQSFLFF